MWPHQSVIWKIPIMYWRKGNVTTPISDYCYTIVLSTAAKHTQNCMFNAVYHPHTVLSLCWSRYTLVLHFGDRFTLGNTTACRNILNWWQSIYHTWCPRQIPSVTTVESDSTRKVVPKLPFAPLRVQMTNSTVGCIADVHRLTLITQSKTDNWVATILIFCCHAPFNVWTARRGYYVAITPHVRRNNDWWEITTIVQEWWADHNTNYSITSGFNRRKRTKVSRIVLQY